MNSVNNSVDNGNIHSFDVKKLCQQREYFHGTIDKGFLLFIVGLFS